MSGQFGTSAKMSWVRSVLGPNFRSVLTPSHLVNSFNACTLWLHNLRFLTVKQDSGSTQNAYKVISYFTQHGHWTPSSRDPIHGSGKPYIESLRQVSCRLAAAIHRSPVCLLVWLLIYYFSSRKSVMLFMSTKWFLTVLYFTSDWQVLWYEYWC